MKTAERLGAATGTGLIFVIVWGLLAWAARSVGVENARFDLLAAFAASAGGAWIGYGSSKEG